MKFQKPLSVGVRIRPQLEADEKCSCDKLSTELREQAFGTVWTPSCTQDDVFRSVVDVLEACFEGYNGCILAYGQTGSGKTYTMLGENGSASETWPAHGALHKPAPLSSGIIPRAARYLFVKRAQEEAKQARLLGSGNSQYQVRVSFTEIYCDRLVDLLANPNTRDGPTLRLRDAGKQGAVLEGVQERKVEKVEQVLQLVQEGSARRVTKSTGVHAHSSRSHALFSLILEHRWRDSSSSPLQTRTSRILLVDLAGSERAKRTHNTGQRMIESISINRGLMCLGKVINALAKLSENKTIHVPFRDSTLTRLLGCYLGGNSLLHLIACISPAQVDEEESRSTLRYAQTVTHIQACPKQNQSSDAVDDRGPLENDMIDPHSVLNRCTFWLDLPSFPNPIFARATGNPQDRLILMVHGSGPRNSSLWWTELSVELQLRAGPGRFYSVAIDCPGYGKSPGDRQTVRSQPGLLLKQAIAALGYTQAYALVGSSQGACAVFNAALECGAALCSFLAVQDPVGHAVFRYEKIRQPSLLIFDVDDDGHPVKVGRWMAKALPQPHYYEFSSRRQSNWITQHMCLKLLDMFAKHDENALRPADQIATSSHRPAIPEQCTLAGGLLSWLHPSMGEWACKSYEQQEDKEKDFVLAFVQKQLAASGGTKKEIQKARKPAMTMATLRQPGSSLGKKASQDWSGKAGNSQGNMAVRGVGKSNRANRTRLSSTGAKRTWPNIPARRTLVLEEEEREEEEGVVDLFEEEKEEEKQNEEELEAERAVQEATELAQRHCHLCMRVLWRPRRLELCRHVLCGMCYLQTSRYTACCPLASCCTMVDRPAHVSVDEKLAAIVQAQYTAEVEQAAQLGKKLLQDRKKGCRLVLEYGNHCVFQSGGKVNVRGFCRLVNIEVGQSWEGKKPSKQSAILRVDFNINPDYPSSALKVSKHPFEFSRTMKREFPCDMTVHFDRALRMKPVLIPYTVVHETLFSRRVVVELPSR
eukprot:g23005.t1